MAWNSYSVAAAARDLLKLYFHGYLGVIERRYGIPSNAHLPVPTQNAYLAAAEEDSNTPGLGNTRVYVICPGLADSPEENGDGGYHAPFALMVGIEILNRKNREQVFSQLSLYQEAVRECIVREGYKVFGAETVIDWSDDNTDEGDANMALTQGAGVSVFSVYLNDVIEDNRSLFDTPPPDPYAPLPDEPVIDQVAFDIFTTPITEPFE